MAAISHAMNSLVRPVKGDYSKPLALFAFKGENYDEFKHSFAKGKLFIRRTNGNLAIPSQPFSDDIVIIINDSEIYGEFCGNSLIRDKCSNIAITFKFDNMFMRDEHIQALGECVYSQLLIFESAETVQRGDKFIIRHSQNFMYAVESTSVIKQFPLLISISYEHN